jgi:hypothetical protein
MKKILLLLLSTIIYLHLHAQENYEIQVYASELVKKKFTMVELHSNYTFDGQKNVESGVLPTNHMLHETIEITHGITDWMEIGFYFFNAIGNDNRTTYVGSHIRPRAAIPEKYHLPVGISLSAEVGYQKPEYSEDDWTLEIRPIIDKQFRKLYLAFNPTFDKSLHGLNVNQGFIFSPNIKAGYAVSSIVSPGVEYYGAIGPLNSFFPYPLQQHQIFVVVDLDFSKKWEFNAGYGISLTNAADNAIFKIILGRRFR